MNREDLPSRLTAEGVQATAYDLTGAEVDETYCLGIVPGGWAVWFSERGRRVDEDFFETEDEACSELLMRLIRDPTTRRM